MSEDKNTETVLLKVHIDLDKEKEARQKEKDYSRIHSVALAIQDFSYAAAHIKDIDEGEIFWAGVGLKVSWYLGDDVPKTEKQIVSELFNYIQAASYGDRLEMIERVNNVHSEVVKKILHLPKRLGE